MEYDEDAELTRYIWEHYSSLMTSFERRVGSAIVGRMKADASGDSPVARMLRDRWGRADDPEVNAALAEGGDAYRRMVACRVLNEHPDEVLVNRCPNCARIVRTPRSRQCFWCGFDWHNQEGTPQCPATLF